ncbi:MAG: tyrosine-type recombinase/integrase [Thermoplasmata archaeon]
MPRIRALPIERWIHLKENRRCVSATLARYREIAERAMHEQRRRDRPLDPSRWTEADFDHLRREVVRSRWAFGILIDFARFAGGRHAADIDRPSRPSASGRVRWVDRATMRELVMRTRGDPVLALIAVLGLGQGLRRVEWKRLQVGDVDLAGGRLLVRGKGRGAPKMVWVPLHPSFSRIWKRFLDHRARVCVGRAAGEAEPAEALVHRWKGRLRAYSDTGLDRIVARMGARSRIGAPRGRLASHMLRRSGATLLEEVLLDSPHPTLDGVYRAVQAFLRHDDLATTMRYLQGNPARQRRALADYGRALPWDRDLR